MPLTSFNDKSRINLWIIELISVSACEDTTNNYKNKLYYIKYFDGNSILNSLDIY